MIELYRNFIKNSTWEPNDPKSYTSREESWEHWHKEILYYERTPTPSFAWRSATTPLVANVIAAEMNRMARAGHRQSWLPIRHSFISENN